MQVGAGDATGGAAEAQLVSGDDPLAFFHVDAAEVHGESEEAEAVVDDDTVAFKIEGARQDYDAAVGCADRCSIAARKSMPLWMLASLPLNMRRVPKLSVGAAVTGA